MDRLDFHYNLKYCIRMVMDPRWDDPAWRAQKDQRVARAMKDFAAQHLQVISVMQTYDKAPRIDSQWNAAPCFGYWQNPGDADGPMSNTADEWGI